MAAVETEAQPVNYPELTAQLEQQEIESAGGVASPQVYGQLLALYLLHNDLPNAKFLWKRIPVAVKTANPELSHVWVVGQKMWQRDFPGIYEALNRDWSESLKPLMTAVLDSTRQRGLNLVSQGYSTITADQLAQFVGQPVPEVIQEVTSRGWTADPQTKLVTPLKPSRPTEPTLPSDQQMGRLTDFVCFLEN